MKPVRMISEATTALEARGVKTKEVYADLPGWVLIELANGRLMYEAISAHRDQKADDRCWMDDQVLYEILGDEIAGDNRVGDQAAMLENCKRFIETRCKGGTWPTYARLEKDIALLVEQVHGLGQGLVKSQDVVTELRKKYEWEGSFCWAKQQMDTGKKARHPGLPTGCEVSIDRRTFWMVSERSSQEWFPRLSDIERTDWELVV